MPLYRQIAGIGVMAEGNALQALDETGGGYAGYYYTVSDNPANPVGATGGGDAIPKIDDSPSGPDRMPVRLPEAQLPPIDEPITPIYPPAPITEIATELPNQMNVVPAGSPSSSLKVLPALSLAGVMLAMTGSHPLKKWGAIGVLGVSLAMVWFEWKQVEKQNANTVLQPNIL